MHPAFPSPDLNLTWSFKFVNYDENWFMYVNLNFLHFQCQRV